MHRNVYAIATIAIAPFLVGLADTLTSQGGMIPFGPRHTLESLVNLTQSMRNAVMSGIQDSADFAIKIHPPVEKLEDTLKSLDGVMMMEDAERRAANEDFVDAEQRLLSIQKAKIREIVAAAMEPIHAMVRLSCENSMAIVAHKL